MSSKFYDTNLTLYTSVIITFENGEASYTTQDFKGDDFSADFHSFGVLWQSNYIIWVVDGLERFCVTNNIPNLPMYLLLNLAVGGKWSGYPDSTMLFSNYYDIDYVRVWQNTD
jgi:beta-glucanase (GH16 family)